ncbi:MAG TPA: Fic family protein [Acidimicrobiales bacterium]|nr:Fic family protein [Acidimicrobiales bacterium]
MTEVDRPAWEAAVEALRPAEPDRAAMVRRGVLLAAAYQSAALDGVVPVDGDLARSLVRGGASLASLDGEAQAHVRANLDALELARNAGVSEATIRGVHAMACRPQLTHQVLVEGHLQDHVMAPGDYKHHPNHIRLDAGGWRATAPVALVRPEMSRLVERAAGLHPVAQARWLHGALLHVQPFADGNGRVARALAGGVLLRAASVPLVVFEDGDVDVVGAVAGLVDLMADADRAALEAWRARSAEGEDLRRRLVPAIEDALRRPDAARRADVSGAIVGTDLVVRVPGVDVEEALTIDAHPLDDGPVSVTAREAGLRLVAGEPVEPWVERVVSVLALRVAAETE